MNNDATSILQGSSPEIKKKFKVKEIGIFGSQIKSEAKKRSDDNIFVEFKEKGETFDNYIDLKFFLEDIFHKKVDLLSKSVFKETLKSYIYPRWYMSTRDIRSFIKVMLASCQKIEEDIENKSYADFLKLDGAKRCVK